MLEHGHFLLTDGTKLAYSLHGKEHLSKGKSLPLVLIAGVGNTQVDWARLVPCLCKKRPVLTFDFRGIGLSVNPTFGGDNFSIELLAKDVVDLIKSFGWKAVDILGYSMGGVLLQQILLFGRHPINPVRLPFRVFHALFTATNASAVPTKDLSSVRSEEERQSCINEILKKALSPKWIAAPENKERLKVWQDNIRINRPFETIVKQRQMLSNFSFANELKFIDPPTKILVIHGTDDRSSPFSCAEEILRACPRARLVCIGSKRGQVPSYCFGHTWYEYFDVEIWINALELFLDDSDESIEAKL